MTDTINILQNIQGDLVGLLMPVMITAVVSLISISVTFILKVAKLKGTADYKRYLTMSKFYPPIKSILFELMMVTREIEDCKVQGNLYEKISKYVEYNENPINYRKNHEEEYIDLLIQSVNKYKEIMVDLNNSLTKNRIPKPPVMHPFLKKKVIRLIGTLMVYSTLWKQYDTQKADPDMFQNQIEKWGKQKYSGMDYKAIERYATLMDTWLLKY